jgi:hypothetical protein
METRIIWFVIASCSVLISIIACNRSPSIDDQAISALKSPQNLGQSNFGLDFWSDQEKRNTPLWGRAVAYCNQPEHKTFENCETLQSVPAVSALKNWLGAPWSTPAGGPPPPAGLISPHKH